jgi:hypothetical protein
MGKLVNIDITVYDPLHPTGQLVSLDIQVLNTQGIEGKLSHHDILVNGGFGQRTVSTAMLPVATSHQRVCPACRFPTIGGSFSPSGEYPNRKTLSMAGVITPWVQYSGSFRPVATSMSISTPMKSTVSGTWWVWKSSPTEMDGLSN